MTGIANGPWGWTIPYGEMDSEMTAIFKAGGDQEDYEVFKASQRYNRGATVEDFIATCKRRIQQSEKITGGYDGKGNIHQALIR